MKRYIKRGLITLAILFVFLNVLIAIHCYKLTHVVDGLAPITAETKLDISIPQAIRILFTGIDLPRSVNTSKDSCYYKTLRIAIDTDKELVAYHIPTDSAKKGIVIIFHGYMDNKSSMLDLAQQFGEMGYDTLLPDFAGAGESYGNQTTMGYLENEGVYQTYNYAVNELREQNVILYGFSMGAVAVMKAQADYQMQLDAIMLQAPYATLEGTIGMRAKQIGLPSQPTSMLFTFWIGKVNGFDGFDSKPIEDAKKIRVPTLVMCGSKDPHIPSHETESIYDAISADIKMIQLFENSKHETLLKQHADLWKSTVSVFLHQVELN